MTNPAYMPNYSRFTTEDFLDDDAFVRWVRFPTPATDQFWQTWLEQHPARRPVVESARRVVLAVGLSDELSPAEHHQLWQTIDKAIRQPQSDLDSQMMPGHVRPGRVRPLGGWRWQQVAAMLTGALLLGAGTYEYLRRQPNVVATEYSELRHLTLPDGSAITLNAHSTLRYGTTWQPGQTREVWLDGEAFFNVRHTATNQKFVVHTPDLTVEVLGTEFDLFKRNGTTKVALASGRVRVSANDGPQPQQLVMNPGDLVEFSDRSRRLTRRVVNVANYAAWTRRKLIFDETPVAEVVALLHDNYNLTVRLTDASILTETISGEIQTDSEATLLRALGKALQVRIEKNGNTLVVSRIP